MTQRHAPELTILWRGPLESCNYACGYCPFAKVKEGPEALARDRLAVERFVAWVAARGRPTAVFFTPWGEALIRPWYQEALARLTRLPHATKAAIQTNLSSRLEWLERCDPARVGLWATFHPDEVPRARFVARVLEARRRGARVSAGVVGLREHLDEAEALRRELPGDVYVWINAYKKGGRGYYAPDDVARLEAIDPLFRVNTVDHPSRGRACRAGASVISVDGDGVVRRCHFVEAPVANIYEPGFEAALRPTPCPNGTCGCHIGYVHLEHLGLDRVFEDGLLERIPAGWPWGPTETARARRLLPVAIGR